jgi:8-hydroxy-5-deazaflavin:NADPH oxidoreductase
MESASTERVGIIGAGRIGHVMAQIARRAGHPVMVSNSRGPETLTSVVAELGDGVSAGTVVDAASANIVVLAVMWPDVPKAVREIEWASQIVIDATNNFDPTNLNSTTSSEVVANLVLPARVVKAGNTFAATVLGSDPHQAGGQRVIFLSGDDRDAKSTVAALFQAAGFFAIDLGGLQAGGRMQQVGGPLAGVDLIRQPDPAA